MDQKVRLITVSSLALMGVLCITTGISYSTLQQKNKNQTALVVVQQKRISKPVDITLKLKNLELEMNTPLSVKIVDYLEEAVSDEILANLSLDTSNVNVTQEGVYQYTITYKEKKFNGSIVVKEKKDDNLLQSITLKTLNLKIGATLPNDVSYYIIETIPDELKSQMKLDISKVNVNKAATYQYTITYNNSIYTSIIIITEDQQVLSTANQELKLKNLEIEVNSTLSSDLKDYLQEEVSSDILSQLKLDTSKVNTAKPGTYQYMISYADKIYTGTIVVKQKA